MNGQYNPFTPEFVSYLTDITEDLYEDRLTVKTIVHVEDEDTGLCEDTLEDFLVDIPCRLSKQVSSIPENSPKEFREIVNITTNNKVKIPPGSIITVVNHGNTETFKLTAEPLVYMTHQTFRAQYYTEDGDYD